MVKATFRFYEELNDFLPGHRRKKDFEVVFKGRRSVKDILESLGVPQPKIDLVLANGRSVGLDYVLEDGDRFSVYPVFEAFNIKGITRLGHAPLRKTRFIADKSTSAIAKHMRRMGFDVCFDPSLSEREIIDISNREHRIVLTKSRELFESGDVNRGIFVPPGSIHRQVKKIIEHLDIDDQARPL